MRSFNFTLYAIGGLFCVLFFACENDDQQTDYRALREQQLTTTFNQRITGIHTDIINEVSELDAAANDFHANPSEPNLLNLRNRWQSAMLAWKRGELYEIGDIVRNFIHFQINSWPVDTPALVEALEEDIAVDQTYIRSLGTFSTGFSGLEFLLFNDDLLETLASFTSNPRHLDFLTSLTAELKDDVIGLDQQWAVFGPEFIEATEISVFGGQNELYNGLLGFLGETVKLKLGVPLGEKNGGIPDPTRAEAPFARISLLTFESGFSEFKTLYRGEYGAEDNFGFDDYLIALDKEALNNRIEEQIAVVDSQLDDLLTASPNGELASLIYNNEQAVISFQEAIDQLASLLELELAPAIGATITINIIDGD